MKNFIKLLSALIFYVISLSVFADSVVGDPPGVSPDFIGPGGAIFADGDPVVSPALPGHP